MVKKLLIVIILVILIPGLYFFLGFYNVAAVKPHSKISESLLHIISERSIKRNSGNIENPYDLNDKNIYVKGFEEYDEMCVQCHGWTGIEPSTTGKGLYPEPPRFPEDDLYEYTVEEIFWVTKNGIKMTGMPGYGPTHDDETIWSISIFLDRSRNLSEGDYKKLREKYSATQHDHDHGD